MTSKHLITAVARAILSNPDLEVRVSAIQQSGRTLYEIDPRPMDPAPLIGDGGSIKFALQTVLAGTMHPSNCLIDIVNTGTMRLPRLTNQRPQSDVLKRVVDAAVNHWRDMGFAAEGIVETSESTAIAILRLDPSLANVQKGAFLKLCRAIGRANGYRAMAYVENIRAAAR